MLSSSLPLGAICALEQAAVCNRLPFRDDAKGAVAAGANLDGACPGVHGDRLHSEGAQARVVEILPGEAAVGAVKECCQAGAEAQGFAGNI